jgi:hypothetical protein
VHLRAILPNFGRDSSPARIRRAAETAEELGFDSVWTTEHIVVGPEGIDPYGRLYDSLVTLDWIAGWTQTRRARHLDRAREPERRPSDCEDELLSSRLILPRQRRTPTKPYFVCRTDNAARVRDGYISPSTCGHARALATRAEGRICGTNVLDDYRACPLLPPHDPHGKEGVDGSSPSVGFT